MWNPSQFLNGILSSQECRRTFKASYFHSRYPHLHSAYVVGVCSVLTMSVKYEKCEKWTYICKMVSKEAEYERSFKRSFWQKRPHIHKKSWHLGFWYSQRKTKLFIYVCSIQLWIWYIGTMELGSFRERETYRKIASSHMNWWYVF